MKVEVTKDTTIKEMIIKGLRENDGYCPCVANSKGKPQYKCWCEDFRKNVPVGEMCHCMLFTKIEGDE